jgi:hypothetical protein
MTHSNYAQQPLRPLADTHGSTGVYLVRLQIDALQEPFTTGTHATYEITTAGAIAADVWDHLHALYANQFSEAAVVTADGISALIRLYEPSSNQDQDQLDESFFVEHSAECPCCAAIAAGEFADGTSESRVWYEFYGSAAELVMEARTEIARAVWSRTGQRGTQFWSTIHIEPVADLPAVIAAHTDAFARSGIAIHDALDGDQDDGGTDFSQN